jgi:hypothetical protein
MWRWLFCQLCTCYANRTWMKARLTHDMRCTIRLDSAAMAGESTIARTITLSSLTPWSYDFTEVCHYDFLANQTNTQTTQWYEFAVLEAAFDFINGRAFYDPSASSKSTGDLVRACVAFIVDRQGFEGRKGPELLFSHAQAPFGQPVPMGISRSG